MEAVNLSTDLGTDMTGGSALIAHTVPGNHRVLCSQLFAVSIDLAVTPMSKTGEILLAVQRHPAEGLLIV